MRIGMLTGGGDCPGLNAVIRAPRGAWPATGRGGRRAARLARHDRPALRPARIDDVSGILPRGGTILKTSRTNPFSEEGGVEAVLKTCDSSTR